jgi:diphthamide synthase (EF-2-diphthine--ammonia ligase)
LSSRRFAFQGTPPIDVIPATQREIADAAALSRTVTTSIIADFVALGAIETEYRRMRILQPERLSDLL